MKIYRALFILVVVGTLFSGCKTLVPSVMLRTGEDFVFDELSDTVNTDYVISADDRLKLKIFSNDGFRLIDFNTSSNQNQNNFGLSSVDYIVNSEGMVKLPIIGFTKLVGMNVLEAEKYLEELFSTYYNKPYAMLSIKNRRVIVFPGTGSNAKVISLTNNNTTMIEALALAGGITEGGKAHQIKLIRSSDTGKKVYLIDLSTIEGIDQASMTLQADDIIYVEPRFKPIKEILAEISPIISLLSSTVIIYSALRALTQ